jgi:ABC-type nitrate/sulfonate/bicarbonate transport system substrate-binding protein/signal transduction histidine kinase
MNKFFSLLIKMLMVSTIAISVLNAKELKKIKVQLLWKHQFEFAGFYMAKHKGFYADAGFDVELIEYDTDTNIVDDVVSQKADFGVGYSSLILEKLNKNKDIVLVSAIFQSSPHTLLSLKRDDINHIKDIKNKSIMIGDAESEASIMAMLLNEGLKPSDYTIVPHNFDLNSIIDKKVDLTSSYITNEPYILKSKNIEIKRFYPKDYGFDFYGDMLFTSTALAKDNELVRRFRDATLQGWRYAYNNIDESVELILKKYNNSLKKSKDALIYEAIELKKLSYKDGMKLGQIDKNRIQSIIYAYRLLKLTDSKSIEIDNFIFKPNNRLELTRDEIEHLQSIGSINMCVDPNWMPYEKIENGKHIGIASDYIKLIEERINIDIELIPTKSWSQSLEYIKSRKCDILSLAMATPSRKKHLNFTKPYFKTPLVIATRHDISFIDSVEKLKDKRVGVTKDFAYVELLKNKHQNLNLIDVADTKDGLAKLHSGHIDAYITSMIDAGYIIQKEYISELKISGKLSSSCDMGIAIRDDDMVLLNILNKTIDSINSDKIANIMNKWVSIRYDNGFDYQLFWQILVLFIAIVVVLFYSNYLLKKKIALAIKENESQKIRLLEKSKKAQLGEMISIISHQWKQPLAIIQALASSQHIAYRIHKELKTKDVLDAIDKIQSQVEFMSETIDEFRHFFNPNKKKESISIYEPIDIAKELMRSTLINSNITLSTNIDSSSKITTYKNELTQVILNILKNASEAFDKSQKDKMITITGYEKESNIILQIKDNAGGIDKKHIEHIFEQYFSTKPTDVGTGLGLDLCKTIIEKHCNGSITAYNKDNGALFEIKLPIE